jgi:hypothetical protein
MIGGSDNIPLEKQWWQANRSAIVQVGTDEIKQPARERLISVSVDDLKLAAQSEFAVGLDNPGSDLQRVLFIGRAQQINLAFYGGHAASQFSAGRLREADGRGMVEGAIDHPLYIVVSGDMTVAVNIVGADDGINYKWIATIPDKFYRFAPSS